MQRKLYIDVLTVISCIAVVFLHSDVVFWWKPTGFVWKSANFIESLTYFAVPIFFMITGSTLIGFNERYGIKQYFSKRFYRTVIPFAFWSLIAFLVSHYIMKNPIPKGGGYFRYS